MLAGANDHAVATTEPFLCLIMGRQVGNDRSSFRSRDDEDNPEVTAIVQTEESIARLHSAIAS